MEQRFFDAMSDEEQAKNRKLMDKFFEPVQASAPQPIPGAGYVAPSAFPESRTQRRARERAEAKAARKVKA